MGILREFFFFISVVRKEAGGCVLVAFGYLRRERLRRRYCFLLVVFRMAVRSLGWSWCSVFVVFWMAFRVWFLVCRVFWFF